MLKETRPASAERNSTPGAIMACVAIDGFAKGASFHHHARVADVLKTLILTGDDFGRSPGGEVTGSTGNPEIDSTLTTALADIPALDSAPPSDMPQPVKLRLSSRRAG